MYCICFDSVVFRLLEPLSYVRFDLWCWCKWTYCRSSVILINLKKKSTCTWSSPC